MKKEKFVVAQHSAVGEDGSQHVVNECASIRHVQALASSGVATDRWFELNGQDLTELEDGRLHQDYPPLTLRLQEPLAKS